MDLRMEKALPLQPSKAMSNRRINKPLMERRRRARINQSLTQLKTLVLSSMNKDPARYNRLEKADILEMTVNHLKGLQSQQTKYSLSDPETLAKFQSGFSQCAAEISNYLDQISDLDSQVKEGILGHVTDAAERFKSSQMAPVVAVSSSSEEEEKMDDSPSKGSDTENESPESPESSGYLDMNRRIKNYSKCPTIDVESSSDGEHSTTTSNHSLHSPRSDSDEGDYHAPRSNQNQMPSRRIVFGDFQLVIQKTSDGHSFRFPDDVKSQQRGVHRIQATTVTVPCASPTRSASPELRGNTPDINNNNVPQAIPSQGFPSQGFPSQGFPSQGFPSRGIPSQGIPSHPALVNPWRPW
uniref:Hairy enhancer of split 8 n=1 Tax=Platynereis dumerilii TaxID=6359 RepID=S5TRL6_PLADU|nr:hairy enhancer of split 8 [Platynereis dumerilii]